MGRLHNATCCDTSAAHAPQPFSIGLTLWRTSLSRWKLSLPREVEQVLEVFVMEPQQLAAELEAVGEPKEAANTLNKGKGQLGGPI